MIDINNPTKIPIKKLPKITNILEILNFQNKKLTSIISEFCNEKIIIMEIKRIDIIVFVFILQISNKYLGYHSNFKRPNLTFHKVHI